MKFNKNEWLLEIDAAFSAQMEIDYKTSKGNMRTIKINPATAYLAYYVAQKHADWATGEGVWCSQKKISDFFHMSTRTVSEAFLLLQEIGFLRRDVTKERAGETKYYDLTMPYPSFLGTGGLFERNKGVFPGNRGVVSEKQQTTNITTNKLDNRKTNMVLNNRSNDDLEKPGKAGVVTSSYSSFGHVLSIAQIAPSVQHLFKYKERTKKENGEETLVSEKQGSLVEINYPASVFTEVGLMDWYSLDLGKSRENKSPSVEDGW